MVIFRTALRLSRARLWPKSLSLRARCFGTRNVALKAYDPNSSQILLQKNLIQRNNALYNYGIGTIRCTVFNENGTIVQSSLEMKREDLVSKHGLLPRDLRKIEKSRKHDLVSTLLVRKGSILVNLLTIRALIKSHQVIIFDSVGSGISLESKTHREFINNLQMKLANKNTGQGTQDELPYEFRALEAIFVSAITNLTSEMKVLVTICKGILQDLEYNITRNKLRFLLQQNKKLTVFHRKSLLFRDMLDDMLEQDDLLCSMYLTDKSFGKIRVNKNHTEIELLIETYYNHIDEVVQMVENALSNVKTTEEIINIILDSNRNQMMLLGIRFSIGMLSLGGAIFFGSLYGMNLLNFIEESDYGLATVTITGLICMVALFVINMKRLNKLQKMSLIERTNSKWK